MTTAILMDARALRRRLDNVYSAMQTSAKPKFFKNGRRKGQLRTPGLMALPFTRQQLWDRIVAQVGNGATRCPYCVAVGRNANLITLANCVLDHRIPKARAGKNSTLLEVWSLDNLFACCEECNREKGSMTYDCFVELMSWTEALSDLMDATYLRRCLRTHGQTMQRFRAEGKRPTDIEDRIGESGMLALQENF